MSLKFSSCVSLRDWVAAAAGPRQWSDTRESWLFRASKLAGVSFRQIRAAWYGELTNPNSPTARKLRDAAARASHAEAQALAEKFEAMARAMGTTDADFYRSDIARLLDAAGALRGVARTRNDPKD